ncbi:MAG TPA: Nramp family divalent metal transporter [Tepidisphaeraceae bacterium]|nr:Nramp family divalent metal transporter [Tepidisphaeraceae bacterium]
MNRDPKKSPDGQSASMPLGYVAPATPAGDRSALSLDGMHSSVEVPHSLAGFWKQWRAYAGPALLVSVGYMDPGNWGTDLSSGAEYKYALLWVVGLASLMAIFLQVISARLGVATGKDLAQACRDWYPRWTRWPNYILCEIAIGACDLAEALGSAVALNLLFHIPLLWAVIITGADVLLLLAMQGFGMRTIEAVVLLFVATIGVCYFLEIFVLPQTQPNFREMGWAMIHPTLHGKGYANDPYTMAFLAIGIIGATVMPHNLYLHSALVQSRKLRKDDASIRNAVRFNTIDSTVALTVAFFVNAAILVLAAIVFFGKSGAVSGGTLYTFDANTDWIRVAYLTLAPLLGTVAASLLFAIALLASGQSSTITGTLAGQVVMEGFMHWRIRPWVRRLITRTLAITPAVFIIGLRPHASINDLLNLSQVVLALQLPLAMFPLLHFTSSRKRMGKWRIGWFLLLTGWTSAIAITAMDIYGLPDAISQAWQVIFNATPQDWWAGFSTIDHCALIGGSLGALLVATFFIVWDAFFRENKTQGKMNA